MVQPFLANEIRPHEIWIPLAEELFQRGENSICATFVDEALRHAEVELAALLRYFWITVLKCTSLVLLLFHSDC